MTRLSQLGQLLLYVGAMCLTPVGFCAVAAICVVDVMRPRKERTDVNLADPPSRGQGSKVFQDA